MFVKILIFRIALFKLQGLYVNTLGLPSPLGVNEGWYEPDTHEAGGF